jgi:hypothetical protein
MSDYFPEMVWTIFRRLIQRALLRMLYWFALPSWGIKHPNPKPLMIDPNAPCPVAGIAAERSAA